jgi:hypothetical protein
MDAEMWMTLWRAMVVEAKVRIELRDQNMEVLVINNSIYNCESAFFFLNVTTGNTNST